MTATTLRVTGMTCDHCIRAVTEEVAVIAGVTDVQITLVPGGISAVAVNADATVTREELVAAVEEAGYDVAG